MTYSGDTMIFLIVLGLRLLVPLAIPRYPLPTIIAALTLDGLDQGILSGFTNLPLDNYQSYDKALDVYYLTIAYLSTMRNWTNVSAIKAGQFLIYFRLIGSMLFEVSGLRAFLLLFPNVFEYFFIAYEVFTKRWDPRRLTRNRVIALVAFIWIVIKIPQEYWIHIAQRDTSDFLLTNPILILVLAIAIILLFFWLRWNLRYTWPPPDRAPLFQASSPFNDPRYRQAVREMTSLRFFDIELLEKVALISLVGVIFSQMLPNVTATPIQMTMSVAILIVSNTFVTEWLARRNQGWKSMVRYFIVVAVLNTGLTITFLWLLPMPTTSIPLASTLFFLLLITLLITFYDSYRPSYLMRGSTSTT